MNRTIHRIVGAGRVVVILSWAVFLAFCWYTTVYAQPGKSGRLEVINPSYRWLSLASSAALVLVGAALLSVRSEDHADDSHDESGGEESCPAETASAGELVFQALFLAPIVISLCTTGSGLSEASLSRRGVHEVTLQAGRPAAAGKPAQPPSLEESQPPLSMENLYEYLLAGAPAEALGQRVDVIGQYYMDERCSENQFLVTRIVVTCCLADAEVIGIRAESAQPFRPRAANQQGPWIRVRGTLRRLTDRFGRPALFIGGAEVSEVRPPDNILLYPNRRRAPW